MDVLAHGLWAGTGLVVAQVATGRPAVIDRRTLIATLVLATAPDGVHMLPLLAWVLAGGGTLAALLDYAVALPGQEPTLPAWVAMLAHHLHCTLHSAVVASAVTLACWLRTRAFWLPLWGWWSHIVIDVFSHSADYFASPVLYPITQQGFDGLAWNTPLFMALNYGALAGVWLALSWWRCRGGVARAGRRHPDRQA